MIVGFPTHGLVGSVAASYLVHTLDMSPVAYLTSADFPPTVVMEEGVVTSPIRVYASKIVCGIDSSSDQLVVVISDIQPPLPLLNQLGRVLLEWAENKGIQLVVAIEGQPRQGEAPTETRVVAMANRAAAPLLQKYSFEAASGVVTGFAGGLLLTAIERTTPVLCLVARAHKDYPDARAAARVIETINPLVPLLVFDTAPLRKKAAEIEAQVRRNLAEQQRSLSTMKNTPTEGPGDMYR